MTATLPEWIPFPEAYEDPTELDRPREPVPYALRRWEDPKPWVAWLICAALTIAAGFTRFWGLGFPNKKIFDEAYYPVEGQELLRFGYEDNRGYTFIVHPPLGKWLIGWTSDLFGNGLQDAFGWRVAPAIFGCLTVVLTFWIARRLFRSNVFGAIAGGLLVVDGLSLVLARTAILDVFLEFFVLAAFGALVYDREQMRARLGRLLEDGADLSQGVPSLGPRPWRLVAGVVLGLACATKWTALPFFAGFWLLTLLWDRGAYKAAGVTRRFRATVRRSWLPSLGSLGIVPLATYLFCYTGWFVGENGWNRHWADSHGTVGHAHVLGMSIPLWWGWVPGPIRSLGSYTYQAYTFHTGLDSPHAYGSGPWSWLVLGRPVDFYYNGNGHDCGASACSREVLLIGTPVLWWAFVPMLLWLAWHYISTRDWRAAAVWVAFLAGWVFWLRYPERTKFLFYMAPLMPFLIFGLTLALGVLLGPGLRRTTDSGRVKRRRWGLAGVSVYLGLVVVDFAWMWSILTGTVTSYDVWHAHMWLPSWV